MVTGGSGGLGRMICAEFTKLGARVLAPARQELDLASPASVQKWLQENRHYVPDSLILNAGINHPQKFWQINNDNWKRTLQVNLESNFQLIRALAPGMRRKGGGRIVCVSSILGVRVRPGRCAYSVSKAGLDALVRTAALELGPARILVNAVAPGFVLTELTTKNNNPQQIRKIKERIPLGRLGNSDEIVWWIIQLASLRNTYLTGQTIIVDGGYTLG